MILYILDLFLMKYMLQNYNIAEQKSLEVMRVQNQLNIAQSLNHF